jgi:predicted PolB exonuclease-like 3'-5' exonuclease
MNQNCLMVVDIETIPDAAHHEGDSFPKTPFNQVVAIGFLEAEIERVGDTETYTLRELRCGGEEGYSEKQLLEGFFQYFERQRPRLVTYNGRGFDVPVLKYRAMAHGVTARWLHKAGDRFSNYSYRFNRNWHCDLMDVLSDFGASRSVKLDEVSRLLGFPGKFGIDGSKVKEIYDAGRLKEIRDYCETDVLNTYLVYLRYLLHTADLTKENYNKAISDVLAYIDAEKDARLHLLEFMSAWGESCGTRFLID